MREEIRDHGFFWSCKPMLFGLTQQEMVNCIAVCSNVRYKMKALYVFQRLELWRRMSYQD